MTSFKATGAAIVSLLLVALITRLQYANWYIAHSGNLQYLIDASEGVLNGTPHWRAFQNRLLSPALLHGLGWLSPRPLVWFTAGWLLALNTALFLMVRQLTRSKLLGLLVVVCSALIWLMAQHNSSYVWDFTEAACLLALAYFATRQTPLAWMLVLFVVAAFNRESAVFIGLYLVACGVMLRIYKRPHARATVAWGVGMGMVSVALTEVLRKTLFSYSTVTGVGDDAAHTLFENHINAAENLRTLSVLFHQGGPLLFMLAMYTLILLLVIHRGLTQRRPQMVAAGVTLSAYFASLGVFGLLSELRLYQPLDWCLPLPLLLIASLQPARDAATVPPS